MTSVRRGVIAAIVTGSIVGGTAGAIIISAASTHAHTTAIASAQHGAHESVDQ